MLRAAWHEEKDETKWAATLHRLRTFGGGAARAGGKPGGSLRFMEFRVRPLVRVSGEEVEEYYTNTLVPQVVGARTDSRAAGVGDARRFAQLLVEQKTNREMEKWLENLKAQSRVQMLWDGVRSGAVARER